MSYKNRTKENNQFDIDHAWPGICSLCFEEIAEFNGSNEYGKPKISKLKGKYKEKKVILNDGSRMSISLCRDCFENLKPKDICEIMESEINGWAKEINTCLKDKWTKERRDSVLKKYSDKYIIDLESATFGLKAQLEIKKPRKSKLKSMKG